MPLKGSEILLYEKREQIVYITLNRPERMNAMSPESGERLCEAWSQFDNDDDARVAIITGAGDRAFCAGMDMKEFSERFRDESRQRSWRPGLDRINSFKPTIAAINGFAIGGGFAQAQNCDIRIAAEHAEFAVAEVKWGRGDAWTIPLLWMIPFGIALELLMTGERISAQRAYEIGFVNKVVKKEDLMAEATRMAKVIRDNAPLSVKAVKETFYKARDMGLGCREGFQLASELWEKVYQSEDAQEGPIAFAEKRKPVWKGR